MNIHIPAEIQERFLCLEFRGKPFDAGGRKLIKCQHKTLGATFYYSFNEDFAWLITNDKSLPDWYLEKK
jgi:hypothetical protein